MLLHDRALYSLQIGSRFLSRILFGWTRSFLPLIRHRAITESGKTDTVSALCKVCIGVVLDDDDSLLAAGWLFYNSHRARHTMHSSRSDRYVRRSLQRMAQRRDISTLRHVRPTSCDARRTVRDAPRRVTGVWDIRPDAPQDG